MPIIKFWCLPQVAEKELNELHQATVRAVVGIPELGLEGEEDMTCLFVPDMMKYGLGSEIIVEISGLFKRPERTLQVIDRLASAVGKAVSEKFPDAKVECFVYTFNPAHGFWSSRGAPDLGLHAGNLEQLRISPQCRHGFYGDFLYPAQPTEAEIREILSRLGVAAARKMSKLLLENHNVPSEVYFEGTVRGIQNALHEPVGAKYFRLASGTTLPGRYAKQLWEVRPKH